MIWPRESRRADKRRKVTREIENRLGRGGRDARELETEPKWWVVDGGARRSVSVPKMIRAAVEVTATMET